MALWKLKLEDWINKRLVANFGTISAAIGQTAGYAGYSRLSLFLALSRTRHGLLDVCTPLLVALLWLGHVPDAATAGLGILAALAGYTSVYALNDIVDYRTDKEKLEQTGEVDKGDYLDGTAIRHPLARGYLSMNEAIAWAGGWGAVSLSAAFALNPICAFILVLGCMLEAVYCLMLRVSHLRTLVSGVIKTLGGLAAVFAVDVLPDPALLLLVFFWLFFWEIGGQNIPADWHDIDEDTLLEARTVPVAFGPETAGHLVLFTLGISLLLSAVLFAAVPLHFPLLLYFAALGVGIYLCMVPGVRLWLHKDRDSASALFNRASWYPCALLAVVLLALTIG